MLFNNSNINAYWGEWHGLCEKEIAIVAEKDKDYHEIDHSLHTA
jgi:hypothetical protein